MPLDDACEETKSSGEPGRKPLAYEAKGNNAQYREAAEILKNYSPAAVFRAAAIAAHRQNMPNAKYIYRKLQKDPEPAASELRKAEEHYQNHSRNGGAKPVQSRNKTKYLYFRISMVSTGENWRK